MDFSNNGLGLPGIQGLIEALKNNDSLETLNLGTNSIGDEGAEALAAYMAGQSVLCSPAYAAADWSLQCIYRQPCSSVRGREGQMCLHFSWQMPPSLHMLHAQKGCAVRTSMEMQAACLADGACV